MMGGLGLGMGLFGLLFLLVFLLLIIGGGAWLVMVVMRTSGEADRTTAPRLPARETPMEPLRRRLAAGEITLEGYAQLRQQLSSCS